ncbi:MAG: Fpg/Nei family DNA glycosylase [Acidimicrobiales bacterium]
MPEGHTIHRLAKDLNRDLRGAKLAASSPQGRFAEGAALLDGGQLRRAEAHGKHLFLWWRPDALVHIHLGLAGVWRRWPAPPPPPTAAVRLRLSGAAVTWDLSGPNQCAVLPPTAYQEIRARLGPDPLRRDGDPAVFAARVAASAQPIGALLLDQRVAAGVGNVYRAEILFLTGVHPLRAGRALRAEEIDAIWAESARQLRLGVRRNKIVTIDRGELGKPIKEAVRAEATNVYQQERCRRCGAAVASAGLAGRRIWWCPEHQQLP